VAIIVATLAASLAAAPQAVVAKTLVYCSEG
jgi:hypothetical protein